MNDKKKALMIIRAIIMLQSIYVCKKKNLEIITPAQLSHSYLYPARIFNKNSLIYSDWFSGLFCLFGV
ncbi:hypothetical protein JXI42_03225 [bacterium]|nr:hypothetical protein [bacterium]